MVSRETRKRFEGLVDITKVGVRQVSPADKVLDGIEAGKGVYKLLKGKNPPSPKSELKTLPSHVRRAEKGYRGG